MSRPIDLIMGAIHNLNDDRLAGWMAYERKDAECELLRLELEKMKKKLRKRS